MYTVTIKQGVQDTSGNPFEVDYAWNFYTEISERLYLPMISRQ